LLAGAAFAIKAGYTYSRGAAISFVFVGLAAVFVNRVFWRLLLDYGLTKGFIADRSVALIIEGEDESILPTLARHGIRVSHSVLLGKAGASRRTSVEKAIASIRGSDAQEIVVAADLDRFEKVSDILAELRKLPLPVVFMPFGRSADLLTRPQRMIGVSAAFELQHAPQSVSQRAVKRVMDFVLATVGIVALSPLLLLAAIAIKLDSPGPALFKQRRCGFNGRVFTIFKFRTMSVLEDGAEIVQARRNDPRTTRLGHFLRRTSIDELPQLLNVIGGSMSLVGPRPHAVAHDNHYTKIVSNYALRHHVKPGLSGWAQVHGYRGRTATVADMEQRVKLDLWYIDNWSFLIDIKILALTVVALIRADNVY
jgi:putative colanic acid biosynthesis UDP-glucose lipid carrier transferase